MEPRIATLLDQSPYKRLTLDPSVLTTPAHSANRYIEHSVSVNAARSNLDSLGHHDHVSNRNNTSSHAQSSAPLARVLNGPSPTPHVFQAPSGRRTPQHATFVPGSDVPVIGSSTTSPDVHRRDEQTNSAPYSGGDTSLIQLPKPPQVPRKTAKRPRIPPLLQGLHQPPPLPPKNRLFPPITSDRSVLGGDVGDRFSLGSAFPTSSTVELAKARIPPQKAIDIEDNDEPRVKPTENSQNAFDDHEIVTGSTAEIPPDAKTASGAQNTAKAPRKRTRWSQKETEDLLTGVSRFGIGRWKQILECADFHFQGRTAVDLKDRFRVCRPGEGLKARKATSSEVTTMAQSIVPLQADSETRPVPISGCEIDDESTQRISAGEAKTMDDAVSNKSNLHGPFFKSRRRARREFSDEDDRNLLKGFKRHGATWHKMRDDFELGFGMRQPTDLRDRFRIRYPDLFAQAGYKLKPREQRVLEERAGEARAQGIHITKDATKKTSRIAGKHDRPAIDSNSSTTAKATVISTPTPPTAMKPKSASRPTFELITDLSFSSDEGEHSPVVLNRNILQWADENSNSHSNPNSIPPAPTAAPQAPPHTLTDVLYNPFTASDGLHINPLATLKLPSTTTHWGFMNPPPTAAAPSLPPPAPLKHALPTGSSGMTSSTMSGTISMTSGISSGTALSVTASSSTASSSTSGTATTNSSTRAQQAMMRTPNLPNIVFPYVPSASARNAVLNLPAPADILSSGQGAGAEGWVWIG